MKQKRILAALVLTLVLVVSLSMAVYAQTMPATAVGDTQADTQAITESTAEQGEAPAQPEEPEDAEPETTSPGGGNTPYFIGAGIAVLVFLGVAFYCKTNGNKTY